MPVVPCAIASAALRGPTTVATAPSSATPSRHPHFVPPTPRSAMPGRPHDDAALLSALRRAALTPRPGPAGTRSLIATVINEIPSSARFVLVGEASHGTDEFYRFRGDVTAALIQNHGFTAVAAEADFPDAFRANLWARGLSEDATPEDALADFIRFPEWMWRNAAVRDFLGWLRAHNDKAPGGGAGPAAAGFYGMDVYSLHASAARVVEYLKRVDPGAAERVQQRYHCFDRYGEDAQSYARATGLRGAPSCAGAAVAALAEVLRDGAARAGAADGEAGRELHFAAECNAAVVAGAENYYRQMYFGDELTWNLRDTHFLDTVSRVEAHLAGRAQRTGHAAAAAPKIVVWAHNSHLGDASATDMGAARGEINLGQLMRERYGQDAVFNIGFTTNSGWVTAADEWDSPGQRKAVRPGMPGSFEVLFHDVGIPAFALKLRAVGAGAGDAAAADVAAALARPRLERAIGVIYRPRTERQSHYFYANLPRQFDLIVHLDSTRAVRPLEPAHHTWAEEHLAKEDLAETYPFGV